MSIKGLALWMILWIPFAYARETVLIEGGNFIPLYGLDKDQKSIFVAPFRLDVYPVTNKEFFDFTAAHSQWKKGAPFSILADLNYLSHWKTQSPSKKLESVPVTNVSWFGAEAFCQSMGGRLPTVFEWEYVGAADELQKDASHNKEFIEQLLKWYAKPTEAGKIPRIGQFRPNAWGIYDIHGVIWEWTYDFNSIFITGDNRQDQDKLKDLFCGFGAVGSTNRANYAAFMRYALRNSLKANYTIMNLGFRCAYEK